MFKTVKSKILAIAIAVLTVIIFVFFTFAYTFERHTKPLIFNYYSRFIEVLKDDINDDIIKVESNAKGLALIGSLFYKTDKSVDLTNEVVKKIFDNYPDSLGGGIWFEPYLIDKSKKRFCFYAFRNKDGKVVLDETFNSEEYDYQNQDWYKEIISKIKNKKVKVAWSKPYYENIGSNTLMITAGSGIFDDNEKLIGISTVDWEISSIKQEIKNMKFTYEGGLRSFARGEDIKNNFALFANPEDDYIIVSTDPYLDNNSLIGAKIENIPWYSKELINIGLPNNPPFLIYHGKDYMPYVKKLDNGMELIICIPRKEMFYLLAHVLKRMVIILLILSFLIPALLYLSLNRYVMSPINKLIDIARKIGKGEEVNIKIEKPEEFAQLASTYDKMTKDIRAITNERAKINSELSIAKSIQFSSIPNVFPPFPEKSEFDIFASMEPAKEVGGDFYDFYFIDEDNFMFLIADVSGKGVPAALFMMTVKTLVNNLSQIGYTPKELIETVNRKICETNNEGLFITMLTGIVNIQNGNLTLINCGHNQPLIKRNNGNYEYLNLDSNIVLGAFADTEFSVYETKLNRGDSIFTYTDGITEAVNNTDEMYGEKRLYEALNQVKEKDINSIVDYIKSDIKNFVQSAPQFDDITMLIFKYLKPDNIKTFKSEAKTENYKSFYTWLHETCSDWNLNEELTNKLDMCAEEIYANISFYAYGENAGTIEAQISNNEKELTLKFIDEGAAYNPLEKPDPDITLPPEQRPIGGLGIFMVKEMADKISYKRENNKNILTIIFNNRNEENGIQVSY